MTSHIMHIGYWENYNKKKKYNNPGTRVFVCVASVV